MSLVMPGLVPGIHVFLSDVQDVDGRVKPGHVGGINLKKNKSPCRPASPSFVYWPEHR